MARGQLQPEPADTDADFTESVQKGAIDLLTMKNGQAVTDTGTGTDTDSQQKHPALTQMSGSAVPGVIERVKALTKKLVDRNYQSETLGSVQNGHLLSRELQVCYHNPALTEPAMKAIADLVQTILRIIPPCYLHSPQKSRKPEWLFEDAERVHGEAFEMLLSAAAGGVLDTYNSLEALIPKDAKDKKTTPEYLRLIAVKDCWGSNAARAFCAVVNSEANQRLNPRIRREYLEVLSVSAKGSRRCKKEVGREKYFGLAALEHLFSVAANDARCLQFGFHILWTVWYRDPRKERAEMEKIAKTVFSKRTLPREEMRKKATEVFLSMIFNANAMESNEPIYLDMISSVGIERAQYIEVSKVNHNGNTLDILPSSKNYFARTLCVNQRSIDLRVGRFDCLWEVPLSAITRLNITTLKNADAVVEISFKGRPIIDNKIPCGTNECHENGTLAITTTSTGADLLRRAIATRYTPSLSDRSFAQNVDITSKTLAVPKTSQPPAIGYMRSSPTPPDANVAEETSDQPVEPVKTREERVMRDSETSRDSLEVPSSGRRTRASTRQAESEKAVILAAASQPTSAGGDTQMKGTDSRSVKASAKEVKTEQMKKDQSAAAKEALATMDLASDLSEVSDHVFVTTKRATAIVQQTVIVEKEEKIVSSKASKDLTAPDSRGKKRSAPSARIEELEEEEEEAAVPVTRAAKKAKLEPDPAKSSKPTTTDESDTSRGSRGAKKPINTYATNKSRQRGKKGRDSGVGVSDASRRGTSGEDDNDKSDTDYEMPGVSKEKKGKAATAASNAKDAKTKSAKDAKKGVVVASSTPKTMKIKPVSTKAITGNGKKSLPWRDENPYAADGPMAPLDELPPPLRSTKATAQTMPTDSDPIEPMTSERGSSRKPHSIEIKSASKKPIQRMSQLYAIDDASAKQQKERQKSDPLPAIKPASREDRLRPASAKPERHSASTTKDPLSEATESGNAKIDAAFDDLLSDPDPDLVHAYTTLYDNDEGNDQHFEHMEVPQINTIPATQDAPAERDLQDMQEDAPIAARTRRKTPDAKSITSPAHADAVSPFLEVTVQDIDGIMSSPASVKAKKELAALEKQLSEPRVKAERISAEPESDIDSEPPVFDEDAEEEESTESAGEETDEYVPPPALRGRGKSAEPIKERERPKSQATMVFEEALNDYRKSERDKRASAAAALPQEASQTAPVTRRSRRERSVPPEPEARQRERTPAAAVESERPPPPSGKRAALRKAQQAQKEREKAEKQQAEIAAKAQKARSAAAQEVEAALAAIDEQPAFTVPAARRPAGRRSEPAPIAQTTAELRAPALSKRPSAPRDVDMTHSFAAAPRERSPVVTQRAQPQERGGVHQPRKLDNTMLGLMTQMNQVLLDNMHTKMDDYGRSRDGRVEAIVQVIESGCTEAKKLDLRLIQKRTETNELIRAAHMQFVTPLLQLKEEVTEEQAILAADKAVISDLSNLLKSKLDIGLFNSLPSLEKARKRRGGRA